MTTGRRPAWVPRCEGSRPAFTAAFADRSVDVLPVHRHAERRGEHEIELLILVCHHWPGGSDRRTILGLESTPALEKLEYGRAEELAAGGAHGLRSARSEMKAATCSGRSLRTGTSPSLPPIKRSCFS